MAAIGNSLSIAPTVSADATQESTLQSSSDSKKGSKTCVAAKYVGGGLGVLALLACCFFFGYSVRPDCAVEDQSLLPVILDETDFQILSGTVCQAPCDLNAQPPTPSKKELDDWALITNRHTNETLREDMDRKLGSGNIKTGVPMIIRNTYPDSWNGAELAWDTKSPHPMASVEFSDPVAWKFEKRGGYWTIQSMYPGPWENAELSWDTKSPHPMASVEHYDPVNWELVHQGGFKYRIKSKYPGRWKDAELSYDYKSPHPMASVEFGDPVDWEITQAYTQRGFWSYAGALPASPSSQSVEVCYGTEQSYGWSTTKSWSKSVTQSMTVGFEVGGDWLGGSAGGSQTVENTYSQEVAATISRDFSFSYGKCTTVSYESGSGHTNKWQFVVETKNNHYLHRGDKVYTYTQHVELTAGRDLKPRCLPGYCKYDTSCQVCRKQEACIGPCVEAPPQSCNEDRYPSSWCAYWKSFGFCEHSYTAWMNANCQHTCQCLV